MGVAAVVTVPGLAQAPTATASRATAARKRRLLIKLQHRHERFLRYLDRADPLHPSLAFLLLLQQLAFTRDITAIALGQHVLPHRRNRLAGNHLAPDGSLQRHLKHLSRNDRLELLNQFATLHLGFAAMGDE